MIESFAFSDGAVVDVVFPDDPPRIQVGFDEKGNAIIRTFGRPVVLDPSRVARIVDGHGPWCPVRIREDGW